MPPCTPSKWPAPGYATAPLPLLFHFCLPDITEDEIQIDGALARVPIQRVKQTTGSFHTRLNIEMRREEEGGGGRRRQGVEKSLVFEKFIGGIEYMAIMSV